MSNVALPAPTGNAPIYLCMDDDFWRPFWDYDAAYDALNQYGATDEVTGECCWPYFELLERQADGTFCVIECKRRHRDI